MNKAYKRIHWENSPSTASPLNEMNLNKMDNALNMIDDRVVEIYNQKDTMVSATTAANKASDAANTAATRANTAAANANEAAQAVLDEKYILTARTEMVRSGTARPTAKGNALLEKLTGDGWQEQGMQTTRNLATVNEFTVEAGSEPNAYYTVPLTEPIQSGVPYYIEADVEFISGNATYIYLGSPSGSGLSGSLTDGKLTHAFISAGEGGLMLGDTEIRFFAGGYMTCAGNTVKFTNVMISKDEGVVLEYEPYYEPRPYPNPYCPQPIHSVGDCVGVIHGHYNSNTGKFVCLKNYICNVHPIPCKSGDVIKIVCEDILPRRLYITTYNDSGYIAYKHVLNVNKIEYMVPSGITHFNFSVELESVTPNTVGKIDLTINNKYIIQIVSGEPYGRLEQGAIATSTGEESDNSTRVRSADFFPCNSGDIIKIVTGTNFSVLAVLFYAENEYVSYEYVSNTNVLEVTAKNRATRFRFVIGVKDTSLIIPKSVEDLTLAINDTIVLDTSVISKKVTTFYLNEPLRGIGDIKDEIKCVDGLYGDYREYACVDLGTLNWTYVNGFFRTTDLKDIMPSGANSNLNEQLMLCEMFIIDTYSNVTALKNDNRISVCGIDYEVRIRCSKYTDASAFKSDMNGVMLQYKLRKPTFTPFEEQTPFYNLQSFDEVTHVSIAGLHEELQPTITMRFPRHEDGALVTTTYCNSAKEKIRNDAIEARMDELTAAVLALSQS